jgi:hypothetical protein
MHRDRLEILAAYLTTIPAETFDINSWTCGTTACAWGHACDIPEFKELGLKWERVAPCYDNTPVPGFQGFKAFAAAAVFFDVSVSTTTLMFSREAYPDDVAVTAADVSNRIREIIANEQ